MKGAKFPEENPKVGVDYPPLKLGASRERCGNVLAETGSGKSNLPSERRAS
jgi:hypothetical protein